MYLYLFAASLLMVYLLFLTLDFVTGAKEESNLLVVIFASGAASALCKSLFSGGSVTSSRPVISNVPISLSKQMERD